MIKLEGAHIEELRGIRRLKIDFGGGTFAISGPNGSGKSGIIDAIEFGLTGQIGRLMGRGTRSLTLAEHGPHVDKTRIPDAAFVKLRVFLPALGKSATLTRTVSSPRKLKIEPADPAIAAALGEVADHPEITLSRREILRFILAEPAKRSEEIQALLKLEAIGETRATLNTALNKMQTVSRAAEVQVSASRETLRRHLQIDALQAGEVLTAVNTRRQTLSLPSIPRLEATTKLDMGLAEGAPPSFNKQSALRDLGAATAAVATASDLGKTETLVILKIFERLEADPTLFAAWQQRDLIERGLELVDSPACPLCDADWNDETLLREHLRVKLLKSQDAQQVQKELLTAGTDLTRHVTDLSALLTEAVKVAAGQDDLKARGLLSAWVEDLQKLKDHLSRTSTIVELKCRFVSGWPMMPAGVPATLAKLKASVEERPDQTAALDAQTFIVTAQLRLEEFRSAMRRHESTAKSVKTAKAAYDAYCSVMETELNALYEAVESDFSAFYKEINEEDEEHFTAKFTPSAGALDLAVNFYDRGLFPPGAYHSEGHQDGMGVCLYLALMKRLFGQQFTLALLDDVVMSVDSDHRNQFCKLLKSRFPDTQFIITTHDRLWAEQMRTSGLVTNKSSLSLHGWSVDTGPQVESNVEIWQDIAGFLSRGKVESAAAALRRHLEYISRQLADQLGAQPSFRADGNYELGDLLPSVLKRMTTLCGKAAEAAQSWGNQQAREAASTRKAQLGRCSETLNVEQWAVNKAVHFNEWANFGRKDFEPVVVAAKELITVFTCQSCASLIYATPRGRPETMRCQCNEISLNLKRKPI